MVKLSSALVSVVPKIHHRRVIKVANKRLAPLHRPASLAVKREHIPFEACDNSNDSGLGFDHHLDYHASLASHSAALRLSNKQESWRTDEAPEEKRRRLEIKLESDESNDNFTFPESVRSLQPPRPPCLPLKSRSRAAGQTAITLSSQLSSVSRNGQVQLMIARQPEQQHRARYQTEGSRGAVKDRTGNGFPIVKLEGYDRPATLQVYIGTDQGRVAPHMFYQACRVSGKNSTPCMEKKVDGTIVIEVDIEPAKDMVVTCDCVGILKERNVDVEHRFPEGRTGRSKKKSTRCRMVFRTTITNADGTQETLQATSQQIVCTQPPGVPEICKKSIISCFAKGGHELWMFGKNFLKDTKVIFSEGDSWSQCVLPDKEFLQQSHLSCMVPPYKDPDISEPVTVRLVVESGGKASEPHSFVYLPSVLLADGSILPSSLFTQCTGLTGLLPPHRPTPLPVPQLLMPADPTATYIAPQSSPRREDKAHPAMMWDKALDVTMPPPSSLPPLPARRSSVQMIIPEQIAPEDMKIEDSDSAINSSLQQHLVTGSDLTSTRSPSMDTLRRFVSNTALPAITVSSYFSNIEGNIMCSDGNERPPLPNDLPQIMIPSRPIFHGESSNLLTTVNQPVTLPLTTRSMMSDSSVSQPQRENLSVIVNSTLIQNSGSDHLSITNSLNHKQAPQEQRNNGLEGMISSLINQKQAAAEMTERLDAFVNSAADSHISSNTEATSSITPSITDSALSASELGENNANSQSFLHTLEIPKIKTENTLPTVISEPKQIPMNSGHSSITDEAQVFSDLKASFEKQLSQTVNSVNSAQMNCSDLNSFIRSTPLGQEQQLADLQATLDQQLSPPIVSTNSSDLESLVQTNHSANLQLNIEPKMTPRDMGSTQNLSSNSYSNLQVTLAQQLNTQTVHSSQLSHSVCMQSSGASLEGLKSMVHNTSPQQSTMHEGLSGYEALQHHLSPQMMVQIQTTQESLVDRLSGLNPLLSTSPQRQSSVTPEQALSSICETLEHHLSPQTINVSQSMLEPLMQVSNPQIGQPTSTSVSQIGINQNQSINDLHLSLGHMTSSAVAASQQSHDSVAGEMPLTTNSELQVPSTQAQIISNLQASLEQQINAQTMGSIQTSPQSMVSVESLNNSSQISSHNSPNHTISSLQVSLDQITSQALPVRQSELTSNSLALSNSQAMELARTMSLVSSQTMTGASEASSVGSPVLLSSSPPNQSPGSIINSPGIPMNNTSVISSSAPGMTIHNNQPHEMNNPNIIMNHPDLNLDRLPQIQQTGLSHFGQDNSNVTQCITQYEQCHHEMNVERGEMFLTEAREASVAQQSTQSQPEETAGLEQQLAQMSEQDLIRYINTSCFDTV